MSVTNTNEEAISDDRGAITLACSANLIYGIIREISGNEISNSLNGSSFSRELAANLIFRNLNEIITQEKVK